MSGSKFINKQLTELYSLEYLTEELFEMARHQTKDHDWFVRELLRHFTKFCPSSFQKMYLVVDHAIHKEDWVPSGKFYGGESDELRGLRQLYEGNTKHDIFSPIVFEHPGNVIGFSDLQSYKSWEEESLSKNILSQLKYMPEVLDVTAIAFPRPDANQEVVVFYFLGTVAEPLAATSREKTKLTAFLIPYYFCWMFRFGWIDEADLKQALESIATLRANEVRVLRIVCGTETNSRKDLGYIYGPANGNPQTNGNSLMKRLREVIHIPDVKKNRVDSPDLLLSECRKRFKLIAHTGAPSAQLEHDLLKKKNERTTAIRLLSDELSSVQIDF